VVASPLTRTDTRRHARLTAGDSLGKGRGVRGTARLRLAPRPHFVSFDATTYSFVCDDCVYEKNSPLHPDRSAFGRNSVRTDTELAGPMPLELHEKWVECRHGHEHLVLREGSERAANFT
jgi:hypothetical protein